MATLRKLAVGVIGVLALVVALPTAASAQDLTVTGPFTATGTLASDGCGIFHQVVTGGGGWTGLGDSDFVLDFCLGDERGDGHRPAVGTFSVTAPDGTLAGDLGGTIEAGGLGPRFPLHLTLTITSGTDRFAGATGTIAMEGFFGLAALTAEGTVDGTVTLAPRTPGSVRDCKHGGWRDFVDHHGNPFRNQGHCVRWVRHHT